ncbi:MAG: hypothetical protein WC613_03745 [Candidatus Aenigmatarchaeota archaeon]
MTLESGRSEVVEQQYRQLLEILNENHLSSNLAAIFEHNGYAVTPEDFHGARLVTTPDDRDYLSQRYGQTFYPSTVLIPKDTWLPQEEGGQRGLRTKLRKSKEHLGCAFQYGDLNIKFMTERTYHEDFHEVYRLFRKVETPEDRLLNEMHSYHTDIDHSVESWDSVRSALQFYASYHAGGNTVLASELQGKVSVALDNLRRIHETQDCRYVEGLLLNAQSLGDIQT